MKGFPNQVSDLPTLARALNVLTELCAEEENPKDDGVYGEALIRRGVLGTSHAPIAVEEYLARQKAKEKSDQSHRTRARDLRRLFRLLRFLDDSGPGVVITARGKQIASMADQELTDAGLRLWRSVIVRMVVDPPGAEPSHPYQVLLRLVARRPGITRAKCALALEATDDSEGELNRIVKLSDFPEDQIRARIRETKSNWDNAKKILPAFAEQLGDVVKRNEMLFLSDAPGVPNNLDGAAEVDAAEEKLRRPRSARRVTAGSIAKLGTGEDSDETEEGEESDLSPGDLKARNKRIRDRLRRHNAIVQGIAGALEAQQVEIFEYPFDCLACLGDRGLLVEVKTLDGTQEDEVRRVREALAQLLYYESFVTAPLVEEKAVWKIACFEQQVSEAHAQWLQRSDILVIWCTDIGFDGTTEAQAALAGYLGF